MTWLLQLLKKCDQLKLCVRKLCVCLGGMLDSENRNGPGDAVRMFVSMNAHVHLCSLICVYLCMYALKTMKSCPKCIRYTFKICSFFWKKKNIGDFNAHIFVQSNAPYKRGCLSQYTTSSSYDYWLICLCHFSTIYILL